MQQQAASWWKAYKGNGFMGFLEVIPILPKSLKILTSVKRISSI